MQLMAGMSSAVRGRQNEGLRGQILPVEKMIASNI